MNGTRGMRRGPAGVTLLELLITLTIVSLITLIILQAFRLGSSAWNKGEQRAEAQQRIRVLAAILAQRLAAIAPSNVVQDGRQVIAFEGSSERIRFFCAPDGEGVQPYSAMIRGQAYFVAPGKGLGIEEDYPLVDGKLSLDARGAFTVLEPRVTQLKIRYLMPPSVGETKPHWADRWELTKAASLPAMRINRMLFYQGKTADQGTLPLAVELTLFLQEDRQVREIPLLLPIHAQQVL